MCSDDVLYPVIRKLDGHPIPLDQDEIDRIWEENEFLDAEGVPHVDEAHERYKHTIAEWDAWEVFRTSPPFGSGRVVFWNRENGEAFAVDCDEGRWHTLVNLFAEIVDEEGDCRDADYSGGTTVGGSHRQHCSECGGSWVIG